MDQVLIELICAVAITIVVGGVLTFLKDIL